MNLSFDILDLQLNTLEELIEAFDLRRLEIELQVMLHLIQDIVETLFEVHLESLATLAREGTKQRLEIFGGVVEECAVPVHLLSVGLLVDTLTFEKSPESDGIGIAPLLALGFSFADPFLERTVRTVETVDAGL
jgi:hypothetical protein